MHTPHVHPPLMICLEEMICGISLSKKRERMDPKGADSKQTEDEDSKETEAFGNERYSPPPGGPCF